MEGVPRIPMVFFPLRRTGADVPNFRAKLKPYIRDQYGEDPNSYDKEISEIETLRANAMHVTKDNTGCSILKKYFCQLNFLKSRFPLHEKSPFAITFTWHNVFSDTVHNWSDIEFEMTSALFNIGALHTQLGSIANRQNPEGMKESCTHYQCAAWAFQHLRQNTNYLRYFSPDDITSDILNVMGTVCLAQAQECILEKSFIDNRKSTITAKVALQIYDFYASVIKILGQLIKNSSSYSDKLVSCFNKWKQVVEIKAAYYNCLSYLYMGEQAEEEQKWGERITFYKAALEKLNEALKKGKSLEKNDPILETLQFTFDYVGGKLTSSEKENEFVYHEKVPELNAIRSEIKAVPLVKGIPFKFDDNSISGPDIFARLVPLRTHEASSLYSEEKAKILRTYSAKIEEKDEILERHVIGLQLDQLNLNDENKSIPQELIECCASLSVNKDAIKTLSELMSKLSGKFHDAEANLNEIDELLLLEEKRENDYQEFNGKRPQSNLIKDIILEFEKYKKTHRVASDSNLTLHEAMSLHISNLSILMKPIDEVLKLIPGDTKEEKDDKELLEMKRLAGKVEEMKKQRVMLVNQLRDSIINDDITKTLVIKQDQDLEQVFVEELKKHEKITQILDQNMIAQDNIIRALTEANANYAESRKASFELKERRNKVIQSLLTSYESYDELCKKCQKGIEFYDKLGESIDKILNRVRSVCKVQEEERQLSAKKYSSRNQPHLPSNLPSSAIPFDLPSGLGPKSSHPKLKDYLDMMKGNPSVGQTHNMPSAVVPSPRMPYSPSPGVSTNYNPQAPLSGQLPPQHGKQMQFNQIHPVPSASQISFSNQNQGGIQATYSKINNPVPMPSQQQPHIYPQQQQQQQPQNPLTNPTYSYQSLGGVSGVSGQTQIPSSNQQMTQQQQQNWNNMHQTYQPQPTNYSIPQQQQQPVQHQMPVPQGQVSTSWNSIPSQQHYTPAQQQHQYPNPALNYSQQQQIQPPLANYSQQQQPQQQINPIQNYTSSQNLINPPSTGSNSSSASGGIPIHQRQPVQPQPSSYSFPILGGTAGRTNITTPQSQLNTISQQQHIPNQPTSQTPWNPYQQQQQQQQPIVAPNYINPQQQQQQPSWNNQGQVNIHHPQAQTSQSQQYIPTPATQQYIPQYQQQQQQPVNYNQNQQPQQQPPLPPNSGQNILPPAQVIVNKPKSNIDLLSDIDLTSSNVPEPLLPITGSGSNSTENESDKNATNSASDFVDNFLSTSSSSSLGNFPCESIISKVKVNENERKDEEGIENDGNQSDIDIFANPSTLDKFIGQVEKLENTVESFHKKSLNGPTNLDLKWKEFLDIQNAESVKRSISVARCYPMKNRFAGILPYDENRVPLPCTKDDYINASYIHSLTPKSIPSIATQTPLHSTISDFWHMIWHHQIELIICLTSEKELKNEIYWPLEKDSPLQIGSLKITINTKIPKQNFTERIFTINHRDLKLTRVVIHLQFSDWLPSVFPVSPGPLLGFIKESYNFYRQQRNLTHSIVVHCSGGIGKSGVFLVLLAAILEIDSSKEIPDLIQCAGKASEQRKGIMIDKEYLKFTYQCLLYYCQDILMKRGILSRTKTSFDEKPKSKHTRHPSQDFLEDTFIKKAVQASNNNKESSNSEENLHKSQQIDLNSNSKKEESSTSLPNTPSRKPKLDNSTVDISNTNTEKNLLFYNSDLTNLDISTFQPKEKKPDPKAAMREAFEIGKGSLLLESEIIDPNDPLSSLDPLWTIKKA